MIEYAKARDAAITRAVMQDDWSGVVELAKQHKIPLPKRTEVMQAGIYKAAQECTSIPDEVKAVARRKCIALGFKPTMWEVHND